MSGDENLPLSLPAYSFTLKSVMGERVIFDAFRGKYVSLTPEEWVRQHFVRFLVEERGVPRGLVSIEHTFRFEGKPRRADVVIFDRAGQHRAVVECKAPSVGIDQRVFDQIARYNTVLSARFLFVTNGHQHFCYTVSKDGSFVFLPELPTFTEMSAENSR